MKKVIVICPDPKLTDEFVKTLEVERQNLFVDPDAKRVLRDIAGVWGGDWNELEVHDLLNGVHAIIKRK